MPCTGDHSRICGGEEKATIYEMHDCNNLPALKCTSPPQPIVHAEHFGSNYYVKTGSPCQNAKQAPLTTMNKHCKVVCEWGYELTHNDLECVEKGDRLSYSWATIQGSARCEPVPCGLPPNTPYKHESHRVQPKFFKDLVMYNCASGYTTNELWDGPKSFSLSCEATQKFTKNVGCLAVKCGECPPFEYTKPAEEKDLRFYNQKCSYECEYGYTLDQTPQGQTKFSTTCKADGNFTKPKVCMPVSCGAPPPLGFAKVVGEGKIKVYKETVDYECNTGYTLSGTADGGKTQTSTCEGTGAYSALKPCKPVLCGYPAEVPHSTFDSHARYFPETLTYTCVYGYTMTGKAGGLIEEVLACGADGHFDKKAPVCSPVECGTPPPVDLASLDDTAKGSIVINYADDAGPL
jgi:hypothetical protein